LSPRRAADGQQPHSNIMELRSGHVAGPPLQLPSPEAKAGFEEGVGLVFSQWTALCLAVEQEWGGPDSEAKANYLIDDTILWFYKKKGVCAITAAAAEVATRDRCRAVLLHPPCCLVQHPAVAVSTCSPAQIHAFIRQLLLAPASGSWPAGGDSALLLHPSLQSTM
jgi:hypothetical protein